MLRAATALAAAGLVSVALRANPYPDPHAVPHDPPQRQLRPIGNALTPAQYRAQAAAVDVLRVDLAWDKASDEFTLAGTVRESSGTATLVARAPNVDPIGSYKGTLIDPTTGVALAHESIGTGSEFRRLVRALTFRFPLPDRPVEFRLTREHPQTGAMEVTLSQMIDPASAAANPLVGTKAEHAASVRVLREATASPKLVFAVYADGYKAGRESAFWARAAAVVTSLEQTKWPLQEHYEFVGVFAPSNQTLGSATPGPTPVPPRDSFLGLFHPYWNQFGRWYHVVYPTSEQKFRNAIGLVPHDYALALLDSSTYWGVGNFRELTAIPADASQFTYLLTHELGHYFGLNEEYGEGGPTELQFAPQTAEPWSQNITFSPDRARLKWLSFVNSNTLLPTPASHWQSAQRGPFGAYRGGYAQSEPRGKSHIPGLACTMASTAAFCPICKAALTARAQFDMGLQ